MRVSLYIPEVLYRASADMARRLGLSRGALYGRAIEEYLHNHEGENYVNPLIREHVEPVLVEEMERATRKYATVAEEPIAPAPPPAPSPATEPAPPELPTK